MLYILVGLVFFYITFYIMTGIYPFQTIKEKGILDSVKQSNFYQCCCFQEG